MHVHKPAYRPRGGTTSIMESDAARRFVADWLDAWNTHDVGRVLAHLAEDAVFTGWARHAGATWPGAPGGAEPPEGEQRQQANRSVPRVMRQEGSRSGWW